MTPAAEHDRLFDLLDSLREHQLDAAGRQELVKQIESDPAAIDIYVKYIAIWGAMEREPVPATGRQGAGSSSTESSPTKARRTGPWLAPIALAAAVALVAAGVVIYMIATKTQPTPQPSSPTGPAIATLIDATGDVYVDNAPVHPGDESARGRYVIESGEANLLLRSRVAVTLEGQTRLVMHNSMTASLELGKANFDVPAAAKGFTVRLPDGSQVVDLGTRFEIQIDEQGNSSLSVLEGRVEWQGRGRSEIVEAATTLRLFGDRVAREVVLGPRRQTVAVGPLRDGGFDIGFEWPPSNPHGFIGVTEASNAWVETATNPRMRLFSDDRLIKPHSPPSYAEFMGNDAGGAGLMQPVETQPGVEYELIAFLARSGDANTPTLRIDIADGPFDKPSPGNLHHEQVTIDWPARTWREHRVRFVARSHVTTIRFTEPLESPTRGTGPLIDSIQLAPARDAEASTQSPNITPAVRPNER